MLAKRIIPCLDIREGQTVKGINFAELKNVGDPVELGAKYAAEGADELVYLDISATEEGRGTFTGLVSRIAARIDIPFTVGGGIASVADAGRLLDAGADKVTVNSAAVRDPGLIDAIASKYGSQFVVAAIDAKKIDGIWRVTFYSRTRGCLWTKGETSGNYLDIVSVTADCDDDTLLIRVIPHGPTCHTGAKSCFAGAAPETEGFIRYLQSVIRGRHAEMPEGSYTSRLFDRGVNKIAQKVGEEAVETVIEAVAGNREAMIYEASDLVYHLLVLLEATGCSVADLEKELARRHS